MMVRYKFAVASAILLATFSCRVLGWTSDSAGSPDQTCLMTEDVYEVGLRLSANSNKYAGKCIDGQQFRPALLQEITASHFSFSNYFHEGRYWAASIAKQPDVDKVFFHVVRFEVVSGIVAAHVQIRFRMKRDSIALRAQDNPGEKKDVNDLIISFEAARPKGVHYNFALGAVPNYALVGRVASGSQRLTESKNEVTEQYELLLSNEEAGSLLFAAVNRSNELGLTNWYNTLRPNCTTELFDLFDTLASIKALEPTPERFLTVLSNDPIVTPSLEALKERGLLGNRYADLFDELVNGKDEFEGETTDSDSQGFLVNIEGRPYSLVFVVPEKLNQSDSVQKMILDFEKYAYDVLPQLIQSVGSSVMLTGQGGGSDLLRTTFKLLNQELKVHLRSMDALAPDTPLHLAAYFVPWVGHGEKKSMLEFLDIPARLPFDAYEVEQRAGSFGSITEGVWMASDRWQESTSPFSFLGLGIQAFIQKGRSEMSFQVLGGLGPKDQALDVKNDQVHIKMAQIPRGQERTKRPAVIFTLVQNLKDDLPQSFAEFGPFGGLAGTLKPSAFARFQIYQSLDHDCTIQSQSVPRLIGVFGPKAIENDLIATLLKGKDVSFQILGADFDLQTRRISSMNVKVATFPFRCKTDNTVNREFSREVNQEIMKFEQRLLNYDSQDIMQHLLGMFL